MQKTKLFEGVVFGIDFDGTCVMHCFPEVGASVPEAENVLAWIVKNGGKLVLNTMRSDRPDRDYLSEAVSWFDFNKIPLYGINRNPTQWSWTGSPKVYAHIYIDDAALGCPLAFSPSLPNSRPFVNWKKVKAVLIKSVAKPEPIINGRHIVTE